MKYKSLKIIVLISALTVVLFSSFKIVTTLAVIDAELVMVEAKVKIIGMGEYTFTQANGNFFNSIGGNNFLTSSDKEKIYNRDVYVSDIPTMFSIVDSTYKAIDSSFVTNSTNNFTWSFTDLTDTNNIIQYTTTKPITRVSQFDLTNVNSVSKSAGFSYSHPLVLADSIIYVLGADSLTSLRKTVLNQSYGVTFSVAELNTLASTNEGAFLILIFNTMPRSYNGKNYYFQNNSSVMAMPLPIN